MNYSIFFVCKLYLVIWRLARHKTKSVTISPTEEWCVCVWVLPANAGLMDFLRKLDGEKMNILRGDV